MKGTPTGPYLKDLDQTLEGMALPESIRLEALTGEFGDLTVVSASGMDMWDVYEIRSSEHTGKPPLTFFLDRLNDRDRWAARCPVSVSDREFFRCLDDCPDVNIWKADPAEPGSSLVSLYLDAKSPLWEDGLTVWRGERRIGVSPAAFHGQESWEILLPDNLERLLISEQGQMFPVIPQVTQMRISGSFGVVHYDLEEADVHSRTLKFESVMDNGPAAAYLYGRLILGDPEYPGLQNAVDAVLSRRKRD